MKIDPKKAALIGVASSVLLTTGCVRWQEPVTTVYGPPIPEKPVQAEIQRPQKDEPPADIAIPSEQDVKKYQTKKSEPEPVTESSISVEDITPSEVYGPPEMLK